MKTNHPILTPAVLFATLALNAAGESHRDRSVNGTVPEFQNGRVQLQGSQSLGTLTRLSDLVGREVRNRQDERLGKVGDAVLDVAAGRIVAIIVSSGGVLGFAERQVSIPPSAFHYDEAKQVLHLDATKESLQNAPEFDSAHWEEFRRQPAAVAQVYQYHGVTPYFTNGTVNADNSALNRRDRGGRTLTPLDQGNTDADTAMTARIRKDVMARDGLSVTAKNVKIITTNGRVTLRGPVNSEEERRQIGEIAVAAHPSGVVDNQLEVKQP